MKLRFHPKVQGEVDDAVEWYEEQRDGLGDDFFTKLTEAFEQIAVRPEAFSFWLASRRVRRVKLKRFPYEVLFEILPDRARVLCVRHVKRHPNYGQGR